MKSGDIIGARYVLHQPLAKGGMGNVWIARHLTLDIEVALKVLAPEHINTPMARERFEREAKACAHIQSPYVVAVHDYGVENGEPFLVMELLTGEDLHTHLARQKRISLHAADSLLSPVCKGLRRAHELGIVHRDIKPSNIFIAHHGDERVVKILDFGVAKMTHDLAGQTTRTGTLLGSPCYMSPEQARGWHIDHRSDLWSLGVVLYECLTGRLPFLSQTIGNLLIEICIEPVPPPTKIAPDLPATVDAFFERALARNPDARFQSADEFARALHALAHAEPNLVSHSSTLPASEFERTTVAMPTPSDAPPTGDGIAHTIAGNRPRATKVMVGIVAMLVLSLGTTAIIRLSKTSNTDEPPQARPASSAEVLPRLALSSVPMDAAPSTVDSVAEFGAKDADGEQRTPPSPLTSSSVMPPATPSTEMRRPARKNPVPATTRDPTFGF